MISWVVHGFRRWQMLEEEGVKIYLKSFWQLKLVVGTWLEDLLGRRGEWNYIWEGVSLAFGSGE